MLARRGAQREEPLFDAFELARVEIEVARGGFEDGERLVGFVGGALGCRHRLVEQALGAIARPFEAPGGAREGGLRAGGAGQLADRLAKGLGQALGVLQQGPARRQTVFLARFGGEGLELGQMMAQQILFLAAGGDLPRRLVLGLPRRTPAAPGSGQGGAAARLVGQRVEDQAVVGGVEQAALLELALDFDEAVAELAQQADARRLVVDKGAPAAVAAQQAAQHDRLAGGVEPGLAQDRLRRMVLPDRELGGDGRLGGAVAHQAGLGPLAERQPERVQQDRLPRPGLAGQHAETRTKRQIEPVDQDNFAYGQPNQHSPDNIGAIEGKPGCATAALSKQGPPVAASEKRLLYRYCPVE